MIPVKFHKMADNTDETALEVIQPKCPKIERKRRRNDETKDQPTTDKLTKTSEATGDRESNDTKITSDNNDENTGNNDESTSKRAKMINIEKPCAIEKSNHLMQPNRAELPDHLTITDLPVECLAHVFNHLDFVDLIHVADVSENTAEAAGLVYSRKYSNHVIKMAGLETPKMVEFAELAITISAPSVCLKLLSIFGDSIKNLRLEYLNDDALSHEWSELPRLIHKICVDNLIELKLINCDEKLFAGIEKVFTKLRRLRISCSRLGNCMDLGKWFPNLKQLELLHNDGCEQIVSHFPHLSYLAMDTKNACLSTSTIEAMIKSAPQLETLALSGGMTEQLLRFINEHSPNLKRLFLWDFHLDNQTNEIIAFKTIGTLSISTGFLGILPSDVPFEFEKLTELRLNADTLNDEWIDFAMEQHDLVKLQLNSFLEPDITDIQMAELANALTKLSEFDVFAEISTDGLAHFLTDCKALQKLRIKHYGRIDYGAYEAMAGSEWNTIRNEHGLTFERKKD